MRTSSSTFVLCSLSSFALLAGACADHGGKTPTLNAVGDSLAVEMNTPAQLDVLSNDLGIQGAVTVSVTNPPGHGSAVLGDDGNLVFTPAMDFLGADTLDYTVTDDHGKSSTANVAITVGCATCATAVPITLTWGANAPSEMVMGYRVYFGHANDATMLTMADDIAVTATGFDPTMPKVVYDAWDKFQLRIGDMACFALTAYNTAGESGFSNIACITVERHAMQIGL